MDFGAEGAERAAEAMPVLEFASFFPQTKEIRGSASQFCDGPTGI
jgi:hypothetical protein